MAGGRKAEELEVYELLSFAQAGALAAGSTFKGVCDSEWCQLARSD
jgi:hypothetical protein